MFWYNIKIAFRNICRNYTQSILNISGMAIGITSAFLILLFVQDEWSYDRYSENADNIYRLIEKQTSPGGETSLMAPTSAGLTKALKEEYPEIISSSKYASTELRLKIGNEFKQERAVVAIDKDFFKIFDVEFVQGDANRALNDPHGVILTEETAYKYFGKEYAIGKTLQESMGYFVTVTGVVRQLHNSHLKFDFLVPFELLEERGAPINSWEFRCYNYIELKKGTNSNAFENKIKSFLKKHVRGSNSEILLQNIKKIHLFSSRKYNYDISGHGDIIYVRLAGIIAFFILLIACINFMNLATAQSTRRAKEIAIRKVAGAKRQKIIFQFLGEYLIIIFIAHAVAMAFVELLLPAFNNLTGKSLAINFQNIGLYMGIIGFVLFCGLLAGSYPALYLSSLKPFDIIKGGKYKDQGNANSRRMLVIFQFSLSLLLIISTLVVGKQLNYIQNKKLGFNKDNIGYFMFPVAPWDPKMDILKNELLKNPDIVSATKMFYNYENPLNIEGASKGYSWSGKTESDDVLFYSLEADEDYAKTFQLDMIDGRFFSSEFATDKNSVVINETAVKIMGYKNPIGEMITTPNGAKLVIVGVVKDFHFRSLHYKIEPLIMKLGTSNTLFIRMKPDHIISTVEDVKKVYNSFKPDITLDFHFLNNDFDKLYQTEQKINKIVGDFSILAIIVSCLGLIGLSTFMTGRRTKEIGIRKTNGAKSIEIFFLLSKEYIVLVVISIFIATPISWFVMNKWLQSFAYKTELSWWIYLITGLATMIIVVATVCIQAWRAACRNPVEALRYE